MSETAVVCFFVNLVFGTPGLDLPEIMWRSDVFASSCLCISHLPTCVLPCLFQCLEIVGKYVTVSDDYIR